MKKVMFLAASAALALSSCSNEVVETEEIPSVGGLREIKVSPYVAGQTRADEANSETLQTNGFYLSASYMVKDEEQGTEEEAELIPFSSISYNAEEQAWNLGDAYTWPGNTVVNFLGAYVGPAVDVNENGLTSSIEPVEPYFENGIWTNVSVSGQSDLMAAKRSTSLTENGSTTVNLEFNHILAKINSITIKKGVDSEFTYRVGGVYIQAFKEATYDFDGNFEVDGNQYKYEVNRGYISSGSLYEGNAEDPYDVVEVSTDGYTFDANSFMVLPLENSLLVYYDIRNGANSIFDTKENDYSDPGDYRVAEVALELQSGSSYDIVITIGDADAPIKVSAGVKSWEPADDIEEEVTPIN